MRVISEVLNIETMELGPNPAVYRTPGWDSLATIEIVLRIERELNVRIADDVITESIDCAKLAAAVCDTPANRRRTDVEGAI